MTDLTGGIEGARWRKATRSNGSGGACVEVAANLLSEHGSVYVRDSKNPSGPALAFGPEEWTAFLAGAKDRAFDR